MFPAQVVVADPKLRTTRGHYWETTLATVRAVNRISPQSEIVVLSGPQAPDLTSALDAERCLARHQVVFTGPIVDHNSPRRLLVKEAWRASTGIAKALKVPGTPGGHAAVPILFTDLSFFELLVVAFLRLRHPRLQIAPSGIVRMPATDTAGRLSPKYDFLIRRLKPLWRLATTRTQWWADSPFVKTFIETQLGQPARLAPICVAGVWHLGELKTDPLAVRQPMKVGYVGEAAHRRGFDLFTQTAAAMHEERQSGQLAFVATVTTKHCGQPMGESCDPMDNNFRLLKMLGQGVESHACELPDTRFAAAIADADIVWAVGDPHFYGSMGTSGIYTHAMCLGKRVITNAGSWAEKITAPIPTARFIRYRLDDAVAALRALATVPADDASVAEVERWRQGHSRRAFDEFIAARLLQT